MFVKPGSQHADMKQTLAIRKRVTFRVNVKLRYSGFICAGAICARVCRALSVMLHTHLAGIPSLCGGRSAVTISSCHACDFCDFHFSLGGGAYKTPPLTENPDFRGDLGL